MKRRFTLKRLLASLLILMMVVTQSVSVSLSAADSVSTGSLSDDDKQDTTQENYQTTTTSTSSDDLFNATLKQTSSWTDKSDGEAEISIDYEVTLNKDSLDELYSNESRALYMATTCPGHGLTQSVLAANIYQLTQLYDWVDVILFNYSGGEEYDSSLYYPVTDTNEDSEVQFSIDSSEVTALSQISAVLSAISSTHTTTNSALGDISYVHPIGSSNDGGDTNVTYMENSLFDVDTFYATGAHSGQLLFPYYLQDYYELITDPDDDGDEDNNFYYTVEAIYVAFDGFVNTEMLDDGSLSVVGLISPDEFASNMKDKLSSFTDKDFEAENFTLSDTYAEDAYAIMQYYDANGRYITLTTRQFDYSESDYDFEINSVFMRNITLYSMFLMRPSYVLANESTLLETLSVGNYFTYSSEEDFGTLDYTSTFEQLGLTEVTSDTLQITFTTTIDSDFAIDEASSGGYDGYNITVTATDSNNKNYVTSDDVSVSVSGNTITVTVTLADNTDGDITISDYYDLKVNVNVKVPVTLKSGTLNFNDNGNWKDTTSGTDTFVGRVVTLKSDEVEPLYYGETATVASTKLYRQVYYLTYNANDGVTNPYTDSSKYYDSQDEIGTIIPTTTDEFNALFNDTIDGTNDYVTFIGWTTYNTGYSKTNYLTNEDDYNDIQDDLVDSTYTFTNSDITLYAVWAIDLNNNNTPDWEDEYYTITYYKNSGELHGEDEDIIDKDSDLLSGRDYNLKTAYDYGNSSSASQDDWILGEAGDGMIFMGWSKDGSYHTGNLLDEEPNQGLIITEIEDLQSNESVYAVWAVDLNNNNIPDWRETTHSIVYDDNDGDNVMFLTVAGLLEGYEYDLITTYDYDDVNYSGETGTYQIGSEKDGVVFIGWSFDDTDYTTTSPVTTLDQENAITFYTTYTFPTSNDPTTATSLTAYAYAVWAIDENNNGIPDYKEPVIVDTSTTTNSNTTPSWYTLLPLFSLLLVSTTSTTLTKRLQKRH